MIDETMSAADYHARPEISNSGLKLLARSPLHYRHGVAAIAPDTARIGRATHAIVLERGDGVVTGLGCGRQTNADRASWSAWLREHGGSGEIAKGAGWLAAAGDEIDAVIVTPSEREALEAMARSVAEHPAAGPLLSPPGKAEVSIVSEIDDVAVRARLDWWTDDRAVIVDLKTTIDASRQAFRRQVAALGYHRQDAFYRGAAVTETGIVPRFVFVAVEKSPPYAVGVYELDDEARMNGEYLVSRDLEVYARCLKTGKFPGYPEDRALDIPIYEAEPEIAITMNGEAA